MHLRAEDELSSNLISNSEPHPLGLKTFTLGQTAEQQFRPIVRVFPNSYVSEKKEIDLRGKKPLFLS